MVIFWYVNCYMFRSTIYRHHACFRNSLAHIQTNWLCQLRCTKPSTIFLTLTSLWQFYYIPEMVKWLNGCFMRVSRPRCRSQWPRGLRSRSAAARLLRLWVRIPPWAWMSVVSAVCCEVEVSATSRSLIQRSPNDYGVSWFDLETSWMRRSWPNGGCRAKNKLQCFP